MVLLTQNKNPEAEAAFAQLNDSLNSRTAVASQTELGAKGGSEPMSQARREMIQKLCQIAVYSTKNLQNAAKGSQEAKNKAEIQSILASSFE